ncbi:MerR family transcriptional regulator [Candidatus Villigracilis saccharophilus]|uniref:MerR family transcriptional regulator n=1 Tax=Candidatus Villigracilis saccharophilus TaxID=3140684 RepID=UPI00313680DC|nr:MerR family transcriptional regulator [Anaerolineales bacterium]
MFTVKQLSKMAGVTPRTLHHYDDIGLLKPSRVGDNGYRYYGEESLLKLQQILFYRELDFPLDDIKKIMGRHDFDVLNALQNHKDALLKQVARMNHLLTTVDNTIQHLKGEKNMDPKGLFEGFSEEEQQKYALEAEKIYDPETVRESNRKWKGYSAGKKEAIMAEGRQVYEDMIAAMPKGISSAEVQAIVERWRKHMDYFWTPDLDQLLGLANGYNDDPRFKANFDKMHPQLAEFMREAVKVYVEKRKN